MGSSCVSGQKKPVKLSASSDKYLSRGCSAPQCGSVFCTKTTTRMPSLTSPASPCFAQRDLPIIPKVVSGEVAKITTTTTTMTCHTQHNHTLKSNLALPDEHQSPLSTMVPGSQLGSSFFHQVSHRQNYEHHPSSLLQVIKKVSSQQPDKQDLVSERGQQDVVIVAAEAVTAPAPAPAPAAQPIRRKISNLEIFILERKKYMIEKGVLVYDVMTILPPSRLQSVSRNRLYKNRLEQASLRKKQVHDIPVALESRAISPEHVTVSHASAAATGGAQAIEEHAQKSIMQINLKIDWGTVEMCGGDLDQMEVN